MLVIALAVLEFIIVLASGVILLRLFSGKWPLVDELRRFRHLTNGSYERELIASLVRKDHREGPEP